MKRVIILCALLLMSCSSSERADWDSGADANRAFEQQRMEDTSENVNNQNPSIRPSTEVGQPF